MYIIEGPTEGGIGNAFGFWHIDTNVPEGRFAVVEDGEYANGGRGPSILGGLHKTRLAAEKRLAAWEEEDKK